MSINKYMVLSRVFGVTILILFIIPYIFPFISLTSKNLVLTNSNGENFSIENVSNSVMSGNLWDFNNIQSNLEFLFFLILGLIALLLSYKFSKFSSVLWMVFGFSLFTKWSFLNLSFRIGSAAVSFIYLLPGGSGISSFTASPSIVSLIILLTVGLALIVSILELTYAFKQRDENHEVKQTLANESNLNFYSLLTGTIIILYLPLIIGPFFMGNSLIFVFHSIFKTRISEIFGIFYSIPVLLIGSLIWIFLMMYYLSMDLIIVENKERIKTKREFMYRLISLLPFLVISLWYLHFTLNIDTATSILYEIPIDVSVMVCIIFYVIYFFIVAICYWKIKEIKFVLRNLSHSNTKIRSFIQSKRKARYVVFLVIVLIIIFPSMSFYITASIKAEYFPTIQNDVLSYDSNITSNVVYNNGTILLSFNPVILSKGILSHDLNESNLIITDCFGDLSGNGIYSEKIDIVSLNKTFPPYDVAYDNRTFFLENEYLELPSWSFLCKENSDLRIEINNQSLIVGETISLVFCVPFEHGELLGSVITQYCINFFIEAIIIQASG